MTMTVEWIRDFPAPLRALAEPPLMKALHCAPTWVRYVYVKFVPDSEDGANITVEREYRILRLQLTGHFFDYAPAMMLPILVHEVCHAHTTPTAFIAREIVSSLVPEEKNRAFQMSMIHESCELATEDLAERFLMMMEAADAKP